MSRIKPYTTNQESWNTILQKKLRIPMNQREYSWGEEEITKFLDDIFKIHEEDKYVEKMGSIINLNYNNGNDIYDGQQRILTTILILNVIGCLSPKLKDKINQLLTVDTEIDNLTKEQEQIKQRCNVTIIPKIYCINPFDMEGLVNIFNNKTKSWVEYLSNIDDFETFDEDEEYCCNAPECKTTTSKKADFKKHIISKHGYSKPATNTKIHSAFIEIYNYFVLKKYDEQSLIKLYKFILHDIDVQYYDCNDPEYVSRIFDWENNRGKAVEELDIIKNPILVKIPDDKKVEIYERWEFLKHKDNNIYKKNFGQKIFDVAIQLYRNEIKRTINHEELFKDIIDNEDTYKEINIFFQIVEELFKIMDRISNDRFGRLLNNTSRICLNWEAYMWCLLPIFYKTNNINSGLIKLMTKWYFRNIQFKTRNFNNLCYSNEFIKITNEVLKNNQYDYYKEITECLRKNKDIAINDENYLRELSRMNFKSTNATHLLLFYETCINTDLHKVPLEYTLEHVYCQKEKANLSNQSLMNNIGNLTLIEGKNSDNGHKGNSSLGSKSYSKKKKSYEESSSKVTRNIAEQYETFEEKNIIERNEHIINELNKYTNY
uniref:C2H2-type domain-containing protein n=1 Tax=viral metagenome TaxID=1070528 RepID=A0A6C0B092_9ZZZZ